MHLGNERSAVWFGLCYETSVSWHQAQTAHLETLIHPMGIPEPEFINGADLLQVHLSHIFCYLLQPHFLLCDKSQGTSPRKAETAQRAGAEQRLPVGPGYLSEETITGEFMVCCHPPRVTRGEGKWEKCLCWSSPGSSFRYTRP